MVTLTVEISNQMNRAAQNVRMPIVKMEEHVSLITELQCAKRSIILTIKQAGSTELYRQICTIVSSGDWRLRCTSQWRGNRCHIQVKPAGSLSPAPGTKKGGNVSMLAGLSVGLSLVVLSLVAVLVIISRKKPSTRLSPGNKCKSISSITYGDQRSNLNADFAVEDLLTRPSISVYPWHTSYRRFSNVSNTPTSFSNPLYDDTTGNRKASGERISGILQIESNE
ncbi:hypothetical protein chiPu_0000133 [Chiloscyllium punctatum]|uniref:Uncharacterized protein n=1 Tax=Chiloscyllium punctatum TaxID=137246 RepID=A0A401RS64_CHIPU|nr:hypothetical protein [Chiloscyllium punctatum]